jgi:hypothetical protein
MSILGALKQQTESIDDLAKLPQAMIMQMAQKGQIREDMLAPILGRKAEMADAAARTKALQSAGQVPPTIMEQLMSQNALAEAPPSDRDIGVAQLPINEDMYAPQRMAGGGIVAFQNNMDQPVSSDMPPTFLTEEEKRYLEENPYLQRSRGLSSIGRKLGDAFSDPRNYNPLSLYQRYVGEPFARAANRFINETPEEQAKRFRTAQMARTGEIPMFAGNELTTKGKMVAEGRMNPNESVTDVMQKERKFANMTPAQLDEIARGQGVFPEGSPALPGMPPGTAVAKSGNVSTKPNVKTKVEPPASTAQNAKEEEPLYSKYEKMLMDEREAAKGAREEAKYARMLEAGLGILGGESPYAFVNIGKGSAPALKAYGEDVKGLRAEERGRVKELLGIEGMRQDAKKIAADLAIRKELAGYAGRQAAAAEKSAGRQTSTEQIISLGKSAGLTDREIMTMLSGASKDPDISARNIAMKAFYESPVLQAQYKNDINAFLRAQGIGAGAGGQPVLNYVPGKGI